MTENFAELYSIDTWKTELISDELGNLAEEISKECVGGAALFILANYGEIQVDRDRSR